MKPETGDLLLVSVAISAIVLFLVYMEVQLSVHLGEYATIDFCVEAAAVFVAVLLGLAVDKKREALRREDTKRDLLRDFRNELEQVDGKLTGARFPNRLRTVTWDSAVASGQLNLLGSEQMRSFTDVYNFIKEVDDDAQRVRDLYTEYEKLKPSGSYVRSSGSPRPSYGDLRILLDKYAANHRISESQLHEKIRNILEAS